MCLQLILINNSFQSTLRLAAVEALTLSSIKNIAVPTPADLRRGFLLRCRRLQVPVYIYGRDLSISVYNYLDDVSGRLAVDVVMPSVTFWVLVSELSIHDWCFYRHCHYLKHPIYVPSPAVNPAPPPTEAAATSIRLAAQPPYLPAESEYGDSTMYYSCRPSSPYLFDLLGTLPSEPFGILDWRR